MPPSTDHRAAAVIAEKIRAAVATHDFPGVDRVNVSLGVAERLPDETVADCFKRVDTALYAAKDGGRNRVVVDRRGCSDDWAKAGITSTIRLQWSETYQCGEATIDAQYRKLFELANRLIETAFDGVHGSLAFHAAFEALLAHVAQLKAKSVTGGVTLGEVVEFLAHDVVARHLLTADRNFSPCSWHRLPLCLPPDTTRRPHRYGTARPARAKPRHTALSVAILCVAHRRAHR